MAKAKIGVEHARSQRAFTRLNLIHLEIRRRYSANPKHIDPLLDFGEVGVAGGQRGLAVVRERGSKGDRIGKLMLSVKPSGKFGKRVVRLDQIYGQLGDLRDYS